MQRISYTTSQGTVTVDDVNVSSLTGEKVLRLGDFDGNSGKTRVDAMNCVGMPGQRVLSGVLDVKTVTAKISFAPVYVSGNRRKCTGAAGMFALRREILKRFPAGENGTLEYMNDIGAWTIPARIDQAPVVTMSDGYYCECTVMFTCDYPYWCRQVVSEEQSVSAGGSVTFTPSNRGDVASPIGGIIKCTQTLSGPDNGIYYRLANTDEPLRQVNFCGALEAGETVTFNLLYNNKWDVPDDVMFTGGRKPCINYPGRSSFLFSLLSSSGSLDVNIIYYDLYIAI